MDRLDAMKVLLAAVDSGSLSAASRALNAPLPSVSRKVADLERHLGTRLIIRTSRNVQLTEAGRDYVDAAREILARLSDAELRASGEYEQPRGEIAVAMPVEFGRFVLQPVVASFLDDHPGISLNITFVDRAVQLAEEHIDIAIQVGTLEDSSLSAIKLGDVTLVTCASPAYLQRYGCPSHPDELENHHAVFFKRLNAAPWYYESNGRRFDARPRFRMRVDNAIGVIAAALNGVGIARALSYQVRDHFTAGELVCLLQDYSTVTYPVHMLYLKQGLMPLKVRAFLDWAAPVLRQRLRQCAPPFRERKSR
jgi:DNA-binding transcriptional LysR family regulator